ncbi:MAG: GNAT family N-acetyltransferase [Candidatus Marinimicrobia bacterium]|nr:GNAT family N-acetyltransferase [Candidatus Neomarinimicrobiota bacterium]MBT7377234.1 GNAT family N-acetyltransferase [Candidatus Neomarinimicrobiota bacterium]
MKFKIEPATKHDLESILLLNQDSMPAVSSSSLDMMEHFLIICDYFKVCKINGEIIGFLNAIMPSKDYNSEHYQWFNDKYKSFIYIDRITFNKSYQNQGYGTIFYNDLIKNTSLDIACEINTKPYNNQSIQFHEKYGFTKVGSKEINTNKSVIYMIYKRVQ